MSNDLSRKEEQRGTRRIMMWVAGLLLAACIVAAAVFVLAPYLQNA